MFVLNLVCFVGRVAFPPPQINRRICSFWPHADKGKPIVYVSARCSLVVAAEKKKKTLRRPGHVAPRGLFLQVC